MDGAKTVKHLNVLSYPLDETMGTMFYNKELNGYRTSFLLIYQSWIAEGNRLDRFFPKKLLYLIENKPIISPVNEISYKILEVKNIPKYYINLERRTIEIIALLNIKKYSCLSNLQRLTAYDGKS